MPTISIATTFAIPLNGAEKVVSEGSRSTRQTCVVVQHLQGSTESGSHQLEWRITSSCDMHYLKYLALCPLAER